LNPEAVEGRFQAFIILLHGVTVLMLQYLFQAA
jgi:hypothetical protein